MNVFEKIREKLEERKGSVIIDGKEMYQEDYFIDIDDAIKIVNQVEEEFGNPTLCYLGGPCEYQTEDVNHNNGWIPVEERLPDGDRYILLHFANFTLPEIGRYEEDEEGGAFYIGDEDETCVQQDLFVNAWMELPERYKCE